MRNFFLYQELCGDRSSRFTGRVGSIIHKYRPAFILINDGLPDNASPPPGFTQEFDIMKPHIQRAAAATGKIHISAAPEQVLATCVRVGANPLLVATARHVARVILQEGAGISAGPSPEVEPANLSALRDLEVEFEATDEFARETIGIEAFEFIHSSLDIALLRLKKPSSRLPIPLAAALTGTATTNAPICVVGYPVTPPSASGQSKFEAVFGVGDEVKTGIKRASPGRLKAVSEPPGPISKTARHDATTLPGSSGSPVIDATTGGLIGLHYQGDTGTSSNTLVYLPGALSDPALRDRFDPDVQEDAVTDFATIPPETPRPSVEVGRAIDMHTNADEMFEAVPGGPNDLPSSAPGAYANSPRTVADRHDIRDRYYQPALCVAKPNCLPAPMDPASLREQWLLADCCGCAIATTIDRGLAAQGREERVSARMIYEMGRLYDEFVDDLPEGTSLRGAIKGLYHSGVSFAAEDDDARDWFLSVNRAKEARQNTLGAYYRLRPSLPDFQMAIQEAGAVVVSAWTHSGWHSPKKGIIPHRRDRRAPHAFVLVGYDETGFLVQNSWGAGWGCWQHPETGAELPGVAHWSYADWADTVMDAWVLQIAPPAPTAHNLPLRAYQQHKKPQRSEMPNPIAALPDPRRLAIIGHIAHAERLGLVEDGRIGVGLRSLRETALHLATPKSWLDREKHYKALAFIFHDPALGPESAARLSAALIPRFKAARIYPMNILFGADEIRSLTARMVDEAQFASALRSGAPDDITAYLERRAGRVTTSLVKAFLDGIEDSAAKGNALWSVLANFGVESIFPPADVEKKPRHVHVVAFGIGVLAAHACMGKNSSAWVMNEMNECFINPISVSLFAPVARRGSDIASPEAWRPDPDAFEPKMMIACLGPDRVRGSVLDGYSGEWTDLIASFTGYIEDASRIEDGRSRQPATMAELLTDRDTLNDMMKMVSDKKRLSDWVSF
ncbi:trypsin-like peptidase domain-containing protein [Rhizobium sp. PAMB 3174]